MLLLCTWLMRMYRFCFALLLVISLWPAAAAASGGAHMPPARDPDRITTRAGSALDIARSAGSLELLRALEQRISAGSKRISADRLLVPGRDRFLAHLQGRAPAEILPSVGVFSPFCERLPYHANAPPSAR